MKKALTHASPATGSSSQTIMPIALGGGSQSAATVAKPKLIQTQRSMSVYAKTAKTNSEKIVDDLNHVDDDQFCGGGSEFSPWQHSDTPNTPVHTQKVASVLSLLDSSDSSTNNREEPAAFCDRCDSKCCDKIDSIGYTNLDGDFLCADCYYRDSDAIHHYHEALDAFNSYWESSS